MALELLTLRPPPNVDFISGFPGLAPGPPDRPHATIQGTLELRTPAPVKAKWLHVELRKVEHVPGSPPFIDTIGTKPTILWEPQNSEYGTLNSRDFHFSIRIPESVPPTVILDSGKAGIKYELIATLCGKGKKSLLRRESAPHTIKTADILMLKHDMHSTWPVYSQPEERRMVKDNMMLVVSRGRTCLGAGGDQIPMTATLYPDVPVSVRSFELALVQKIIYPSYGTAQTTRKGQITAPPPPRSAIISEQKRTVNVRIQQGMHHSCELNCMLPPTYNAMTVSTARLIENSYEVHVSAVLEGGNTITVGLPIIVSPFPVVYSMELMQRMGMPPMALDHPSRAHLHNTARPPSAAPSQMAGSSQQHEPRLSQFGVSPGHLPRQQKPYHIAERVGGQAGRGDNSLLGGPPSPVEGQLPSLSNSTHNQYPMSVNTRTSNYPGDVRPSGVNEFGQPAAPTENPPPVNTVTSMASARFAVVNATHRDELESPRSSAVHEPYISAAEEKRRMAQQMTASDSYASVPPPGPPPESYSPASVNGHGTAGGSSRPDGQSSPATQRPAPGQTQSQWLSAEEEKKRLYEKAKAAADLTHRRIANVNSGQSSPAPKDTSPKTNQFTDKFAEIQNFNATPGPTGATLTPKPTLDTVSPKPAPAAALKPETPPTNQDKGPKWMPAEEEKRRLYEKAQAKALRTQARSASITSAAGVNVDRSNSTKSTAGSIVNPYTYSSTSGLKGADLYKSALASSKSTTSTPQQNPPPSQTTLTPPPISPPPSAQRFTTITPPPPAVTPPNNNGGWLSAEEEKARMRYLEAKRAVDRHVAAQDEFEGAGSSANATQFANASGYSGHSGFGSPPPGAQPSWSMPPSSPPPFSPPLANGTLSPSGYVNGGMMAPLNPTPPPPSSDPPPFQASLGYTHATDLPEKEKMRLAYAAQDAQPSQGSNQGLPDYTAPPSDPPPPEVYTNGAISNRILSAAEEKAQLRAQYASEETSAGGSSSMGSSSALSRPTADPPISVDGTRKLTAAEEKALLQAQYAAERPISAVPPMPPPRVKSPTISGTPDISRPPTTIPSITSYLSTSSISSPSDDYLQRDPSISQGKQRASNPGIAPVLQTPPVPPPLAPRPPKEYIQQIKEEDAKIRRMTQDTMTLTSVVAESPRNSQMPPWQISNNTGTGGDFSLGLRPFSPIDLSLSLDPSLSQGMYSNSNPTGLTPRSSVYR